VLDEPTNHLDLESIAALSEALKDFDGTVLFVSHDRWFVSELATRILEVTPDGPREFPGTYAEYLARCGDDHLDAETVVLRAKDSKAKGETGDGDGDGAASWEEQKRRRNRLAALPGRRDKVLAAIEEAEAKKSALLARYEEPGFFQRTSAAELAGLEAEKGELEARIEAMIAEWEAIEQELAAVEA
jgi:DNA repair exonuclease SbcCD ATPase subunit